jgi:4-hydroxybenzoate polyprenyltransferase
VSESLRYGRQIVRSMRPKQWVKNFMVFPAVLFSGGFLVRANLLITFGAFVVFCLLAGGVYLYNDLADVERDRKHPTKRFRPIAAGDLPEAVAARALWLLIGAAFALAVLLALGRGGAGWMFPAVCLMYLVLQIAYSKKLKHVVILDVGVIALGFDLRVWAGAAVLNIPVSFWVIVCTTLLALFLGFGKRRHELTLLHEDAASHRKILTEYNTTFLDQMIAVVTASTVLAYSLYTMSEETTSHFGPGGKYLPLTIPFVLYGIFRYLYLVHQKDSGGSPTKTLLTDPPILIDIALWFGAVLVILYFL